MLTRPFMFGLYMLFLTWKVDRSLLSSLQRAIDDFERKKMQPGPSKALDHEANAFSRAVSQDYYVDGV